MTAKDTPRTAHDVAEALRAAEETIGAVGGPAEMAERLRRAQAAKRNLEAALPAEQRRERLQLVLRRWAELAAAAEYAPALARLLPPARIAAAEHLLARYGARVVEQPRFMAEFGQTLAVFGDRAATPPVLERADLASRHALPPEDRPPLEQYGPANAAAVRTYEAEALAALEAEFARDGNPLHAWEALALAAAGDQPVPGWVLRYLSTGAANLAAIRQEAAAGKPVGKEADRAGKALGFGTTGRGRGSQFGAKAMLERDREYYLAVVAAMGQGTKLYIAWQEVAAATGANEAKVRRGYERIAKLVRDARAEPPRGSAKNGPISDGR